MKKFYKLCNFQLMNLFLKASLVCIGLFIMQIIIFSTQRFGQPGVRFEQYMQRSGFSTMFLISYILMLVVIALSVYQRYYGSKSIYTMMSLPVSKGALYFSFLLPAVLVILMLCFTQILSVHVCHQILIAGASKAMSGMNVTELDFSTAYMNNALFLSFIRYDYLRLFLPLSILDLARSITLLIAPVVTVIFGAFCERSRKYAGFILLLVQVFILWQITSLINNTSSTNYYVNSIVYIGISLVLTALFAILSYQMLKRKSIV